MWKPAIPTAGISFEAYDWRQLAYLSRENHLNRPKFLWAGTRPWCAWFMNLPSRRGNALPSGFRSRKISVQSKWAVYLRLRRPIWKWNLSSRQILNWMVHMKVGDWSDTISCRPQLVVTLPKINPCFEVDLNQISAVHISVLTWRSICFWKACFLSVP